MAGGSKIKRPRLKGLRLSRSGKFGLWAGLSFLLALGALTTVADLLQLPIAQTKFANEQSQRAVIDPATGVVSLGTPEAPKEKFDVGAQPPAGTTPEPDTKTDTPKPETVEAKVLEAKTPEVSAAPDKTLPNDAPTLRTEPLPADTKAPDFSKDSLVSAPAPEITETIDGLRLPKTGIKGATPSAIYAQPFKRKPEPVLISFVVMDVGLDTQSIGILLDLPKEVTVAYSPYARNAATYSESFRRAGHELWTMLPAMSDRFPTDDPGPMGMVSKMPKEELIRRLHEVMGAVVGSVGMILPPNEAATPDKETTNTILSELAARGLLLVSTHPSRTIDQITTDKALSPLLHRSDLVLDTTPDESQIKSKLAGLIASAQEKGEYVVVLSSRPQTVQILRDWLKQTTLPAPVALAPLSGLYQPRIAPVKEEEKKDDKKADAKKEEVKKEEPKEESEHSDGEQKEKPKPKPAEKKPKVLPQDQYKQTDKKEGGGH